jgi:hypothetical protein
MVKVISYCIYGTKAKYCLGLVKNCELIQEQLPDYEVWIYGGKDVPFTYVDTYKKFPKVRYIPVDLVGGEMMCYRFFPIDDPEVEICHVRDADSRVTERDVAVIRLFEESDKLFHIIREHFWHKRRITGGIWGIKKGCLIDKVENLYKIWIIKNEYIRGVYDSDQLFLEQVIYPLVVDRALIHSNIVGFKGEEITPIDIPRKNDADFLCNVILFDNQGREYPEFFFSKFPLGQHLLWLINQQRYDLIVSLTKDIHESEIEKNSNFLRKSKTERYSILNSIYVAFYYLNRLEECKRVLKLFEWAYVDKDLIRNSYFILLRERQLGKKIIGTNDPNRIPNENEIVICYGNYHHNIDNLPHNNILYQHTAYKDFIEHDMFES